MPYGRANEDAHDLFTEYESLKKELQELSEQRAKCLKLFNPIETKCFDLLSAHGPIQHNQTIYTVENDDTIVTIKPRHSLDIKLPKPTLPESLGMIGKAPLIEITQEDDGEIENSPIVTTAGKETI